MHGHLARDLVLALALLGSCGLEAFPGPAAAKECTGADKDDPGPTASPTADPDDRLRTYIRAASAGLAPEQREALDRVDGAERRVLALKGFPRTGSDLKARWA